jgi:hypothetical protein
MGDDAISHHHRLKAEKFESALAFLDFVLKASRPEGGGDV